MYRNVVEELFMEAKKEKRWYRNLKKFMRLFIKKTEFIYVGDKFPSGSLIMSNHEGTKAPLAWELYGDVWKTFTTDIPLIPVYYSWDEVELEIEGLGEESIITTADAIINAALGNDASSLPFFLPEGNEYEFYANVSAEKDDNCTYLSIYAEGFVDGSAGHIRNTLERAGFKELSFVLGNIDIIVAVIDNYVLDITIKLPRINSL